MKSYRKELRFNLPTRRGFVNITSQVETCLEESCIKEGLILILHRNLPVEMNLWEKYKAGKVLGLHKLLIDSNKWIDCLWECFKRKHPYTWGCSFVFDFMFSIWLV